MNEETEKLKNQAFQELHNAATEVLIDRIWDLDKGFWRVSYHVMGALEEAVRKTSVFNS